MNEWWKTTDEVFFAWKRDSRSPPPGSRILPWPLKLVSSGGGQTCSRTQGLNISAYPRVECFRIFFRRTLPGRCSPPAHSREPCAWDAGPGGAAQRRGGPRAEGGGVRGGPAALRRHRGPGHRLRPGQAVAVLVGEWGVDSGGPPSQIYQTEPD